MRSDKWNIKKKREASYILAKYAVDCSYNSSVSPFLLDCRTIGASCLMPLYSLVLARSTESALFSPQQFVIVGCVEMCSDVLADRLLQAHEYFHQAAKVKTPSGDKRLQPVAVQEQKFLSDQTPYIWTYEPSGWLHMVLGMCTSLRHVRVYQLYQLYMCTREPIFP